MLHVPPTEVIPEVGELDELETFVGSKKNKIWLWTAIDQFRQGILAIVLGDHSAQTFQTLWDIVSLVTSSISLYNSVI